MDGNSERVRVVVYVVGSSSELNLSLLIAFQQRPFIFTFLFEPRADSLAIPSFYRSLHYQLGPLRRPLLASTSPTRISERLSEASNPKSTSSNTSAEPISDLVYDPTNLTVHTTIPNVPEPNVESPVHGPWTRIEALGVHSQILNTYIATRRQTSELERTCKTNRGWWVVWMRLPHASPHHPSNQRDVYREAFLIRRASDCSPPAKSALRFGQKARESSPSNSGWGPSKLAEGIGIDARQYIEGLLSLNR